MRKACPYNYIIFWSKLNIGYYGARRANKFPPEEDLWVHYFTSSKVVTEFRKIHGDPDYRWIVKKFNTGREAFDYELKMLKMLNAGRSPHWLNLTSNGKMPTLRKYRDRVRGIFGFGHRRHWGNRRLRRR